MALSGIKDTNVSRDRTFSPERDRQDEDKKDAFDKLSDNFELCNPPRYYVECCPICLADLNDNCGCYADIHYGRD